MKTRMFIYYLMFFYLGFALKQFLNVGFENWEWWAICAPLWIIVAYQEVKLEKK